ncbi:MAG: Methyltransferase type 11 [Fibrobacteres bacterium]|nr:Methyltransferase type 11 [Fibrobacterota bacterium]
MSYRIKVRRQEYASYREYLSEQEYRLLKKVIVRLLRPYARPDASLLDVACWDGEATEYYGKELGIGRLHGIDFFETQIGKARSRGVDVVQCDLEAATFPFADDTFDLAVANQVFEHLKQIYRPLSELHRVLKPGGLLLFSVPNLAALHCRIQLLFGRQPSTIKLFEAHVRAFTPSAMRAFLTFNGLFSIQAYTGSGYYPFPPPLSERLCRILPDTAVFQLYVLRKEAGGRPNWQDEIMRREVQSTF